MEEEKEVTVRSEEWQRKRIVRIQIIWKNVQYMRQCGEWRRARRKDNVGGIWRKGKKTVWSRRRKRVCDYKE